MGVMTALKAANRQWNNLSPELTREIGKLRFVHPTALLIKNLSFYTLSVEPFVENYNAKRVVITEHGYFLKLIGYVNWKPILKKRGGLEFSIRKIERIDRCLRAKRLGTNRISGD